MPSAARRVGSSPRTRRSFGRCSTRRQRPHPTLRSFEPFERSTGPSDPPAADRSSPPRGGGTGALRCPCSCARLHIPARRPPGLEERSGRRAVHGSRPTSCVMRSGDRPSGVCRSFGRSSARFHRPSMGFGARLLRIPAVPPPRRSSRPSAKGACRGFRPVVRRHEPAGTEFAGGRHRRPARSPVRTRFPQGDGHRIGAAKRAGMNGTRIEGRRVGGKGVAGSWRRCFVPVLAGCGLRTVEGTADVVHPPLCPAGRAFALAPGPGVRAVRKACQCERHSAARPRNDGAVRVGAGCCIQASPEDSLTARRYAAGAVAWCFLKTRLKAASDPYPTRSAISMIGSPVRASSWRASCMRQ